MDVLYENGADFRCTHTLRSVNVLTTDSLEVLDGTLGILCPLGYSFNLGKPLARIQYEYQITNTCICRLGLSQCEIYCMTKSGLWAPAKMDVLKGTIVHNTVETHWIGNDS